MTTAGATRPTPTDPAALLNQLASGDSQAWATVIDAYADLVASVPRSMRLNVADSDDVSQATWLALLENANRIREPARLASWLVTVARRESLRVLRRADRHVPVNDHAYFDRVADPAGAADAVVVSAERYALLRRAIESLPSQGRQLIRVLIAEPDASYMDLAVHIGIPIGSVGPVRARCIRRLRASLA